MKITKNLKINSIEHFYNILNHNLTLSESSPKLLSFQDNMFEYLNGCRCFEDQYLDLARKDFIDISNDSELISQLQVYFKCDGIIF